MYEYFYTGRLICRALGVFDAYVARWQVEEKKSGEAPLSPATLAGCAEALGNLLEEFGRI